MPLHVLDTPYQNATEKSAIKNWLNRTIALRLESVTTDADGKPTAIMGAVFTADSLEEGEPVKIDSVRIIGQLSNFSVGDMVIVHVVPHGQRGQVLAPPPEKDADSAALQKAFAE